MLLYVPPLFFLLAPSSCITSVHLLFWSHPALLSALAIWHLFSGEETAFLGAFLDERGKGYEGMAQPYAMRSWVPQLGALSHPFLGEGSPTKIDYRNKKLVPLFYNLYWRT